MKSSPVYFYAQRNTSFNLVGSRIPFEVEQLNEGKAMDLSSGIFTAPRTGRYFFAISAVAYCPSGGNFEIAMQSNLGHFGLCYAGNGNQPGSDSCSFQTTLNLHAEDQIWVKLNVASTGVYLLDTPGHLTHFSGMLLQEDISQSLSVLE